MIKENAIHRLLLLRHRKGNTELLNESLDMAIEALRQPERKPGRWSMEFSPAYMGGAYCECSRCNYKFAVGAYFEPDEWKFCPECGSAMTEGAAHENQKD